jgi:dienelactone hydrolase
MRNTVIVVMGDCTMLMRRIRLAALVAATLPVSARALEPKPAAFKAKDAAFKTKDDVEITADYYPPSGQAPSPVVILLHMYRSNRAAWKPLVPHLHEAGFAVLAIDLRGHGDSVKPRAQRLVTRAMDRDPVLFNAMHNDVYGAYDFLARQPGCDLSRFALVGASVGGSVALDYARQDRSVDVVVWLSPGEAYLGVDSRAHAKELAKHGKRQMLLMAAPGERRDCDTLSEIHSDATVLITEPGRKDGDKVHGTNMFGQVTNVEREIVNFLIAHIGAPPTKPVAGDVNGETFWPVNSDEDKKLDPQTRRIFSSADEAKSRGYKPSS